MLQGKTASTDVAPEPLDLLQGTLDLIVLGALEAEPRHGYGVAQWLRASTEDALQVEEGALYTCLHRMEKRGWLASEWGISDNGRRAKYYRLTAAGQRQLSAETTRWNRYTRAVRQVLGPSAAAKAWQPESGR